MKKNIYNRTKELYDGLYRNDAKVFSSAVEYIKDLTAIANEKDKYKQELLKQANGLILCYNAQSVIGMADILKYKIEPILSEILMIEHKEDNFKDKNIISSSNYEKNKSVLNEKLMEIYSGFCDFDTTMIDNDESIIIDMKGNIAVNTTDGLVYINSTYDDSYAVKCWCESLGQFSYKDIVFICGISNFSYIRGLFDYIDKDTVVIAYEPNQKIFVANMIYTDIRDVLLKDNFILLVNGINDNLLNNCIMHLFDFKTFPDSRIYSLPGYDVLYFDEIKAFEKKCIREIKFLQVNNNSIIALNKKCNYNIIMNMQFYKESTDVLRLKEKMKKDGICDKIPAIVVAAGPSLDKNIQYLSAAKGKSCILCVDSAIRMLLKNDIIPDMLVTLDPDKERILFDDDRVNDMYLCYGVHGTYDVIKKNRKKKILYNSMSYMHNMLMDIGVKTGILDTGGSVANSAFSIARYLGFKDIIVIGQDLAFTDDKKHASVVYDDGGINEKESIKYTTIEGIDGTEMLTYMNFKVYRDWYENYLEHDKDLNMINATEGGAMIHGAVNMRLEDAINQYCKEYVDIKKYINASEILLPEDKYIIFKEEVYKSIQNLDKIRNCAIKCDEIYNQIVKQEDSSKKLSLSKQIEALDNEMEGYKEMEFVRYHAKLVENRETAGIYNIECDDIWQDTIKRGKNVVKAYIEGADVIKDLFEKMYNEL